MLKAKFFIIFKQNYLKNWVDEYLKWDPRNFDNQKRIVFSSKDIWTPGLTLLIVIQNYR